MSLIKPRRLLSLMSANRKQVDEYVEQIFTLKSGTLIKEG